MATRLKLTIDALNRTLAKSFSSASAFSFPPLIQGETVTLELLFVVPAASPTALVPFSKTSYTGASFRVGLCGGSGRPTGSAGGPVIIAYQNSFSEVSSDLAGSTWEGDLDLNTAEVAAFLAALSSNVSTLEIEITPSGGDPLKVIQTPITVKAEVLESGATVPLPLDQYLTEAGLITRETPVGVVDGANVTYTLAYTPIAGTEHVFYQGILQDQGGSDDYTIVGPVITFNTAPVSGRVIVSYHK